MSLLLSTQCNVVLTFINKDQWLLGGFKKLRLLSTKDRYSDWGTLDLRDEEFIYIDKNRHCLNLMLGLSKLERFLVRRAFIRVYKKAVSHNEFSTVVENRRKVIDSITGMEDD